MWQRVTSPEFVGRGPELAALLAGLDDAADHRFSAIFVAGESGVGKSRLLRQLQREAEARGASVLAGECVTLSEGELPYAPIRAALRRFEIAAPDPAADQSRFAQARTFERVLDQLSGLGERGPVLLVVEDLHWADTSTLDLLAFLLANARNEALLLVCSYRPDELHRRHPLRAFLSQHERPPVVTRVELRPFTADELAAQLHGILGAEPAPGLVQRVHARTEGNAFFAEELLAASAEGTELPASLRETLMLRVDALPDATQRVLRLAAAHGRVVSHRLLAAASGMPDAELHEALRQALDRQVLVRQDATSYAFRHALFAEALEFELLAGERMELHLALAQAIQRDPTLVDQDGRGGADLCAHWLGAHRCPEALAAAVRAAAEAEEVYAFPEAAHQFRRALELWPRVPDAEQRAGMDEPALYARAAETAHLASDETAIALVSAAIEKIDADADPYRAALLHERLGHYVWTRLGDDDRAQRAYQTAVDLLPADEPRPELARVLATLGQILMLRGRNAESMACCERAIAVARRIGARAEEARALNALGGDLGFLGDRATGIAHLRTSLRISEELGDLDNLARGYVNLGEMLDQDGLLEEAIDVALAGARRTAELGMRDSARLLEGEAAVRLLKLGRLDEAEALTPDALDLRPSLARLGQCAVRARIELQRARPSSAEPLLRAARQALPASPSTWIEPLASARVEFELFHGRPEEARRLIEDALEPCEHREYVAFTAHLHVLGAQAEAMMAERARAAGDDAAAERAAAGARALCDRLDRLLDPGEWLGAPPPESLAHAAACAAEAARAGGVATAARWAQAAAGWARLSMPLEEAYARLREAECHLLAGARRQAEAALAAGHGIATACGAEWLAQELDALARRGRLAVARGEGAAPPGPASESDLTERELAVLELVAQGLTNREIGERLFMATKTASVHVSRILAKLGVTSRVEAATAAQRLGLVR